MKNKTYHIITIGCQMNKSDSERIVSYLEERGLKQSKGRDQADLIVVNTCGVRQSAEDRVYGLIPKIKKKNPEVIIVLAGCLSERKDVQEKLEGKVDIWLPIIELPELSKKLEVRSKNFENDYLSINPKYISIFSAFVPIGNGCNNFCAYCVVPYARGREVYRPAKEILNEVQKLVKSGYKEIILIAQNVNSYLSKSVLINAKKSIDLDRFRRINFARLLRIINDIPGNFWIRFATSHPKDMSDQLINAIAQCSNPPSSRLRRARICEHIHLPVQAGDDKILKAMNRNYTVEEYKKLVKKMRKAIPDVSVTTDIIVGFPGETRQQFNNTVKLFKEIKFDMAYIAQYSTRPGTAAAKLKDNVSSKEKKQREKELTQVLKQTALENNKKYIGKTVDVLIDGKNKKGEWRGKTRTGKHVKCPQPHTVQRGRQSSNVKIKVGKFIKVKITGAREFGLVGKLE